jgi:secreted trypsin-like serine protease
VSINELTPLVAVAEKTSPFWKARHCEATSVGDNYVVAAAVSGDRSQDYATPENLSTAVNIHPKNLADRATSLIQSECRD